MTAIGCTAEAPGADLPANLDPPAPVAETALFRFHVDARSSLFYLLDLLGWREHPELQRPSLARLLEPVAPGDRPRWSRAVETFRDLAARRDPTLDPGLITVRDYLAGAASIDLLSPEDRALAAAVEDVLPSYRETWWPEHRAAAAAWVETAVEALPTVEAGVAADIASAMRGDWPNRAVEVYAVYYGPRIGGYATGEPVVTIAAVDSVAWLSDGLEVLFHHAAHAFVLVKSLRVTVERAFQSAGRPVPDRLWHTLLFLTVEEAVAQARTEAGTAPATPLGRALPYYTRNAEYERDFQLADRHWRPYLRGEIELTDALEGLVHDD